MEKVFDGGPAFWKDFVDLLLVIDYLFMAAVLPIASNLVWLVHLPVLIYSGMAYLKSPYCYLINCISIA
jgi:hypothetical protein